jgi:transposase-like protein
MSEYIDKNCYNSLGRGAIRQHYNIEFKHKAMQMIRTSGKPVSEIASIMNVDHSAHYRWKQKCEHEFCG